VECARAAYLNKIPPRRQGREPQILIFIQKKELRKETTRGIIVRTALLCINANYGHRHHRCRDASSRALNFSLLSPRHSRTMAESSENAVVDNAAKDSYFQMHIAPMRRKDGERERSEVVEGREKERKKRRAR